MSAGQGFVQLGHHSPWSADLFVLFFLKPWMSCTVCVVVCLGSCVYVYKLNCVGCSCDRCWDKGRANFLLKKPRIAEDSNPFMHLSISQICYLSVRMYECIYPLVSDIYGRRKKEEWIPCKNKKTKTKQTHTSLFMLFSFFFFNFSFFTFKSRYTRYID